MLTAEQLAQKRQKDFGEDYFKTGKGADVSKFSSYVVSVITHISVYMLYSNFDVVFHQPMIHHRVILDLGLRQIS